MWVYAWLFNEKLFQLSFCLHDEAPSFEFNFFDRSQPLYVFVCIIIFQLWFDAPKIILVIFTSPSPGVYLCIWRHLSVQLVLIPSRIYGYSTTQRLLWQSWLVQRKSMGHVMYWLVILPLSLCRERLLRPALIPSGMRSQLPLMPPLVCKRHLLYTSE